MRDSHSIGAKQAGKLYPRLVLNDSCNYALKWGSASLLLRFSIESLKEEGDDIRDMKLGQTSNAPEELQSYKKEKRSEENSMKFNRYKCNIGRSNHLHKCRRRKNRLGNSSSQKDVGETVYSS